ncbi:hypothetical protein C477_17340 [Haloterrigena salina JCM 13891]|uniref:Uncharacterized protein n=1 Tax=Haloterrigena salina JCM 13891 TaxID=1227488 RepID=M0BZF7_9EURY|nr:hypothetical protein C477_17340 [Haloterrigena salina JCM 13891]
MKLIRSIERCSLRTRVAAIAVDRTKNVPYGRLTDCGAKLAVLNSRVFLEESGTSPSAWPTSTD